MKTLIEKYKGHLWILPYCGVMPLGDVLTRFMRADGVSVMQVLFLEYGFICLALLPFMISRRKELMDATIKDPLKTWQAVRSLSFFFAAIVWVWVVKHVQMTQLYAISFLAPIFSAWIASIMLDDEDLSRSKVLALITGLLGTIVIIRPGFTEVSPFLILGLLAPLLWGFTTVSTKRLSNEYSHLTLLFILALCTMSLSLPFALLSWTPLSPEFWTFALGIATVGLIVHISFIKAYKYAPLIDIVPMEFSMLIFASLYASIFFAEGFDAWVYLGASLIVASNLYIILRS